jgi:hypothetical protein
MSKANRLGAAGSSSSSTSAVDAPKPPAHYAQRADAGDETWIEDAIEDYLGLRLGIAQRKICRAVAQNHQVLVVSANSLGKSYILAAITIVWLLCRYPAVSFATSGTERKMKRTYCKPVESLHGGARIPLPGEYKSRPERIEFEDDPEHFFEASSPRDAGELEGVHAAYTLAIIEEADKSAVDEDVIEAMRSLASDDRDRLIAIANPPEDETNSIYPLMDDHPNWEVVRFSTFDSHNVQIDTDRVDDKKIDGIADISKLKDDWVEFNGSDWPGYRQALRMSAPRIDEDGNYVFVDDDDLARNPGFEPNLSKRWFKRRAGIMPPAGASVNRPYGVADVNGAWDRGELYQEELDHGDVTLPPATATGVDVARSSDRTVAATIHRNVMVIHYAERGTNHTDQSDSIARELEDMQRHPIAVDFIGSGEAVHDNLLEEFPDVGQFVTNSVACQSVDFEDKWAEGMAALGDWLEDGGIILDRTLRKEMLAGARELEYDEKFIGSRGEEGEQVYSLSSKDDIKERLDAASPDYLEAAMIAAWAASDETYFEDHSGEGWLITH